MLICIVKTFSMFVYLLLRVDINTNYIRRAVTNLSAVSFIVNRVINVWNNLPQDTDFSSFNLFTCAIENMDGSFPISDIR